MDCLFEGQDVKLANIKFFRGTDAVIDEDDFREELCASIERKSAANAIISDRPPASTKAPLDLKALIAEM